MSSSALINVSARLGPIAAWILLPREVASTCGVGLEVCRRSPATTQEAPLVLRKMVELTLRVLALGLHLTISVCFEMRRLLDSIGNRLSLVATEVGDELAGGPSALDRSNTIVWSVMPSCTLRPAGRSQLPPSPAAPAARPTQPPSSRRPWLRRSSVRRTVVSKEGGRGAAAGLAEGWASQPRRSSWHVVPMMYALAVGPNQFRFRVESARTLCRCDSHVLTDAGR